MYNSIFKKILSKASILISALIILYSSYPFFLWNLDTIKIILLFLFLSIRTLLLTRKLSRLNSYAIYFCVILWLYLYVFHSVYITDIFTTIITRLLPVIFIILLSSDEKIQLVKYTTNIFAFIILLSLFFFLLWVIGIDMPHTRIEHSDSFYSHFQCYYFFITKVELGLFTRFQSVFTEPGHLGMFVSLLLYLNQYNWRKWQCWVFLISLLWSFSLAAYILFVAGFIMYNIFANNRIWQAILKTFVGIFVFCIFSVIYYSLQPNSVLSVLILSRLEIDKTRGIVGNNRNEESLERYYDRFEETTQYLYGIGVKKCDELFMSGGNSSYKIFILQYGFIGILLLLLWGIIVVYPTKSKLYWGLLILYCLSFWQRPYALWEIELFPFLCFSAVVNIKNVCRYESSNIHLK